MGSSVWPSNETTYQLRTFHYLFWNLLSIHRHHCWKLHANHWVLFRWRRRRSNLHRMSPDSSNSPLVGAKSQIPCTVLSRCQRFYGHRALDHFLLFDPRHAVDLWTRTSHFYLKNSSILRYCYFRDGSDRCCDATWKLNEDSPTFHRHLRGFESRHVWRDSCVHSSRIPRLREIWWQSIGLDHPQPPHPRNSRSDCESFDRSGCFLHFWTSVLRLSWNRMGCNQEQIHKASNACQLHDANSVGDCRCSSGRRCSNHWTICWSSRRILLFHSRSTRARLHRNGDLLGTRFRKI